MLKKLNEAMDYIEEHLEEDFSLDKIAEYVHVSDLHLRKIFFALTNMSLNDYVKNRRMSKANQELLRGKSVTEVAYQYGYQSVDGFSRAFKKWSGMLPSEAAKLQKCKTFQKLSFVVAIKGGNMMEYKIIEKEAFCFAGVSKRVPMQFEGVNLEIVKLAQSITEQQRKEMHRVQNTDPHEIVNVSYESDTDFLEEKGELTHMIGVLTTREDVSDCLEKIPVPAGTWAVFPNEGPFPFTMQDTMARIYSEWFMTADYELTKPFSFSFTKMDGERKDYAYSEIWIPVKKRG